MTEGLSLLRFMDRLPHSLTDSLCGPNRRYCCSWRCRMPFPRYYNCSGLIICQLHNMLLVCLFYILYIYIFSYIFLCVCVCVCVSLSIYLSIHLSLQLTLEQHDGRNVRSTDPCTAENPCITLHLALCIQGSTLNQLQIV